MVAVHVEVERFRQAFHGRSFDELISTTANLDRILRDHARGWSRPSADEAVLVSEAPWGAGTPVDWAQAIQQQIRRELHLDASLGIAATRFAARICARLARPRGILLWMDGYEKTLMERLPLEELDELRPEQLARLRSQGVRSIDELASLLPGEARALMGAEGENLLRLLQGERDLETARGGRLPRAADVLARRLARSLARSGRTARGLELQVVYADGVSRERYTLLPRPTSSSGDLARAALRLVEMIGERSEPVSRAGLTATGLTTEPGGKSQLDLFARGRPREVRVSLGR